jgi:hypothetical protein
LTCESERLATETHFHVGAFDQAAGFHPTGHIFPEERLPWLHLGEAQARWRRPNGVAELAADCITSLERQAGLSGLF